jgi:Sulfotransferase family
MLKKSDRAEQIVAKLHQVNLLVSQGQNITEAIRESGLNELTYYGPCPTADFPIAYLHIPRTAGTALSQMLARHWPKSLIFSSWQTFGAFPKDRLEKVLLVSGHFRAFQLADSAFDQFRVLTVVRDPLARAISSYRYAHRRGINIDDLDSPNMTPGMRFASSHDFVEWFHSRFGRIDRHAQLYILGANADEVVPELIERAKEPQRQMLFSQWLERAKPRLDKMLVGTFEQIELYITLLESAMALPTLSLPRVNTSDGVAVDKIDLSDSQVIEMRKILEFDYELYEYAKTRFRQLYQQQVGVEPHPD